MHLRRGVGCSSAEGIASSPSKRLHFGWLRALRAEPPAEHLPSQAASDPCHSAPPGSPLRADHGGAGWIRRGHRGPHRNSLHHVAAEELRIDSGPGAAAPRPVSAQAGAPRSPPVGGGLFHVKHRNRTARRAPPSHDAPGRDTGGSPDQRRRRNATRASTGETTSQTVPGGLGTALSAHQPQDRSGRTIPTLPCKPSNAPSSRLQRVHVGFGPSLPGPAPGSGLAVIGSQLSGLGSCALGLGSRVSGLASRVSRLGSRVPRLASRVWALGSGPGLGVKLQ